MKKNLAKRIVLGLLTGAVLMSSSVAWAEDIDYGYNIDLNEHYLRDDIPDDSLSIGGNMSGRVTNGEDVTEGSVRSVAIGVGSQVGSVVGNLRNDCPDSVALGFYAGVAGTGGTAIGSKAKANGENSVALGYGSVASEENVVSVGYGTTQNGVGVDYRKIVNVANGNIESADSHEAVTGGQLFAVKTSIEATIGTVDYHGNNSVIPNETKTLTGAISVLSGVAKNIRADIGSGKLGYQHANYISGKDLTEAAEELDKRVKANADAIANVNSNLVIKNQANELTGSVKIDVDGAKDNPIVMDNDGITVGTNSTRMDGTGFYVWADNDNNNTNSSHVITDAIAYMNDKGEIKAADGKFEVDEDGNVTATTYNGVDIRALADSVASNDAVAGLNQRLEKTNAKINKVGAGAAALAALHPLDYDPDDKLTFSAGMGNYAGENAAALGAFYRPNEKFMLSLGGTMGNGENMVNLGLSIGLDKANGFAKMSKRELIQEVNAVKAENEAMKDQLANADERIAKLEALVAQLVAK